MEPVSRSKCAALLVAGLFLWASAIGADMPAWRMESGSSDGSAPQRCAIRTSSTTLSDGYQDISAYLVVTPNAILVHTESPLDVSFSDIGLQVDKNAFFGLDSVYERKSARFSKAYQELVHQLKKGRTVRVDLRFWPTWPVTGTHAADFSLAGFTKAYDDMMRSCGG